jgi:hypothetical protein
MRPARKRGSRKGVEGEEVHAGCFLDLVANPL